MFFILGTKTFYRKVGYVADFCPICRSPQPFQIRRIGLASHLYYLPVSQGKLIGYDRTCQQCKTLSTTDFSRYHQALKRSPASLDELIAQTFPTLRTYYSTRLALEQRVQQSALFLSADERHNLICEVFDCLAPIVQKRFTSVTCDWQTGVALLFVIFVFAFLAPYWHLYLPPDISQVPLRVAIAASLIALIWQLSVSKFRFMRQKILSRLATALMPLQPTKQEIERVLNELAASNMKIGKKVNWKDLEPALQEARQNRLLAAKHIKDTPTLRP